MGFLFTFSPLFIGAMVATARRRRGRESIRHFQSPFHRGNGCYVRSCSGQATMMTFQSPFHRGNGCYFANAVLEKVKLDFQSPFHRGNGCYNDRRLGISELHILSVPFSSGQWLLLDLYEHLEKEINFQSPFHRGNGCYFHSLYLSL